MTESWRLCHRDGPRALRSACGEILAHSGFDEFGEQPCSSVPLSRQLCAASPWSAPPFPTSVPSATALFSRKQ